MKLKLRNLFLYLLSALAIITGGCKKESPVEFDPGNPAHLRTEIVILRTKENGTLNQAIYARFYNKSNKTIELSGGGVTVNGKEMVLKSNSDSPYYSGIEAVSTIVKGMTYNFIIKLADGKTYEASINIPEKELSVLNMPQRHDKTQSMDISWWVQDKEKPIILEIVTNYKENSNELVSNSSFPLSENALEKGEYTVSSTNFQTYKGAYSTKIKLIKKAAGTVYDGFMAGSKIEADLSVSKTCSLY